MSYCDLMRPRVSYCSLMCPSCGIRVSLYLSNNRLNFRLYCRLLVFDVSMPCSIDRDLAVSRQTHHKCHSSARESVGWEPHVGLVTGGEADQLSRPHVPEPIKWTATDNVPRFLVSIMRVSRMAVLVREHYTVNIGS